MSRAHLETLEGWILLASLALRRPREFYDRMGGYVDLGLDSFSGAPPAYETTDWKDALRDVEKLSGPVADVLEEPALREVEEDTRRLLGNIRESDPFNPRWAADSLLARCCYLMCRLLEPEVAVETGVA